MDYAGFSGFREHGGGGFVGLLVVTVEGKRIRSPPFLSEFRRKTLSTKKKRKKLRNGYQISAAHFLEILVDFNILYYIFPEKLQKGIKKIILYFLTRGELSGKIELNQQSRAFQLFYFVDNVFLRNSCRNAVGKPAYTSFYVIQIGNYKSGKLPVWWSFPLYS